MPSVSGLLVITQPFLFIRPRVSVKASSTSSLLDIAVSSNRQVLTIISYEPVDRSLVSLLGLFVRPLFFFAPGGGVGCFLRGWYTGHSSRVCVSKEEDGAFRTGMVAGGIRRWDPWVSDTHNEKDSILIWVPFNPLVG